MSNVKAILNVAALHHT